MSCQQTTPNLEDEGPAVERAASTLVAAAAEAVAKRSSARSVVLVYATVTGNTQEYAHHVADLMGRDGAVQVRAVLNLVSNGEPLLEGLAL